MTDTSRPRPRPRPRPKLKAPEPKDDTNKSPPRPSTSNAVAPSSPAPIEVQDDDEMFMRNRQRKINTWTKWDALDNGAAQRKKAASDSEEEPELSPRPRKHKKKRDDDREKPRWQTENNLDWLLAEDASEHSAEDEDDVEFVSSTSNGAGHKGKRKRARSRSKSITPPPALPIHQIQSARNLVRRALDGVPRAISPTLVEPDDSMETTQFDPELEKLIQSVKNSRPATLRPQASENGETIQISVKWRPHPLNTTGKHDVWVFKMNRDDNFIDLFEAVAEEVSILSKNLIMSYNGKRLFSSVSPASLKIWIEAEFTACELTTYEYLKAHKDDAISDQGPSAPSQASNGAEHPPTSDDTSQHESEAESDDEDKFKLILRSSATEKDVTLTVRPTTKCGAILKAFLRKAGLEDQYPGVFGAKPGEAQATTGKGKKGKKALVEKDPRLCVDGDKLDNEAEIGEADLEDGDLVEVVGL